MFILMQEETEYGTFRLVAGFSDEASLRLWWATQIGAEYSPGAGVKYPERLLAEITLVKQQAMLPERWVDEEFKAPNFTEDRRRHGKRFIPQLPPDWRYDPTVNCSNKYGVYDEMVYIDGNAPY